MKKHLPNYHSVRTESEQISFNIEFNKQKEVVTFIDDLAGGIKPLTDELKSKIALRDMPWRSPATYLINMGGGLGDVILGIHCAEALSQKLQKEKVPNQIILVFEDARLKSLQNYLSAFHTFHLCLPRSLFENSDKNEFPTFQFPIKMLDCSPVPYPQEALGFGGYMDFIWASWGLEGDLKKHEYIKLDGKYLKMCLDKFVDFLVENKLPVDQPGILFFPVGHGLINKWKMWPTPSWNSLIEEVSSKTNAPLFLILDSVELTEGIDPDAKCHQIILKNSNFSFDHLVGALQHSSTFLSIDTGPCHLAATLKKKGVVLFGPTNPLYLSHPSNLNVRVSACPPCYFSLQTLLCKSNVCMQAIDSGQIAKTLLSEHRKNTDLKLKK